MNFRVKSRRIEGKYAEKGCMQQKVLEMFGVFDNLATFESKLPLERVI
jgi:hypothetical protein